MQQTTEIQTQMIDVGTKTPTRREAVARGTILMRAQTAQMVQNATLPKGNALETARIAAIMAAKNTPQIIPLCHPLLISQAGCEFDIQSTCSENSVADTARIIATTSVRCEGKTGVEMEALAACAAALLTIYDMTKGVDDTLEIQEIHLLEKLGGKSGDWKRGD